MRGSRNGRAKEDSTYIASTFVPSKRFHVSRPSEIQTISKKSKAHIIPEILHQNVLFIFFWVCDKFVGETSDTKSSEPQQARAPRGRFRRNGWFSPIGLPAPRLLPLAVPLWLKRHLVLTVRLIRISTIRLKNHTSFRTLVDNIQKYG
jgi:hypothetical protein